MESILTSRSASPKEPHESGEQRSFGFRWFLPKLLRYRSEWRDIFIASLVVQLLALGIPLCTQVIIDKVVAHRTVSTLLVIASALVLIHIFSAVLGWIRGYILVHTGNRIDSILTREVFGHLLHLPLGYFERRPTGTLVARLQGIENIRAFLSGAAMALILELPFIVIFLGLMVSYSVLLTAVTLGILALITGMSLLVAPVMRHRMNEQFLAGARNQALLTEFVSAMETVKSLQMEKQLAVRHTELLGDYLSRAFAARQLAGTYGQAAMFLEQMLTVSVLCLGAWLVMEGPEMTIGMLVAFQMFSGRVIGPVVRLVGLWQEFQQVEIAVRRLGDIMDVPQEPHSDHTSTVPGPARIEFRDLEFRYTDGPVLFTDINSSVSAGQCVLLCGRSGAGKSTVVRLLQGFLVPTRGSILIDGRDTRHMAANEIRARLGLVPQETRLFSGSLRFNLTLGTPDVSDDDIVNACRLAEIHDFVSQLPQGYDTPVGEHGVGLSGGQKQRIAIARALLKRSGVLILDEPTSSIDAASAASLIKTLNRFHGKVTVVLVAHEQPAGLDVDHVIDLGGADRDVTS